MIEGDVALASYYTSPIETDFPWILGMLMPSEVRIAKIDLVTMKALAGQTKSRCPFVRENPAIDHNRTVPCENTSSVPFSGANPLIVDRGEKGEDRLKNHIQNDNQPLSGLLIRPSRYAGKMP
ncbi:MAG: hypothetical protein AB9891_06190 [Anaerolineaceae bacterium]